MSFIVLTPGKYLSLGGTEGFAPLVLSLLNHGFSSAPVWSAHGLLAKRVHEKPNSCWSPCSQLKPQEPDSKGTHFFQAPTRTAHLALSTAFNGLWSPVLEPPIYIPPPQTWPGLSQQQPYSSVLILALVSFMLLWQNSLRKTPVVFGLQLQVKIHY